MRGLVLAAFVVALPVAATAQTAGADPNAKAPFGMPIHDDRTYVHGLLSQFEGRIGDESSFRFEGEGWVGDDTNRLWLKTEGTVTKGQFGDSQQEVYYSRPISTYFDAQVGGRYDLDDSRGRGWGAIGVEGFAPYYFTVGAHAYASNDGHYAFKVEGSDEIHFSQRLILEPQAELNFYTRDDRGRAVGSGLADIDAGLRLRYELNRKLAPYVGVTWRQSFERTADLVSAAGDPTHQVRFTVGVRSWF